LQSKIESLLENGQIGSHQYYKSPLKIVEELTGNFHQRYMDVNFCFVSFGKYFIFAELIGR